jgi:hypothetical protein
MAAAPEGVKLTRPQVAWLLKNCSVRVRGSGVGTGNGLNPTELATLVAICFRESGGRTDARRSAALNPGGGNDLGLFQLNDKANPNIASDPGAQVAVLDAFVNVSWAVALMIHQGQGMPLYGFPGLDLSPWGGPNTTGKPATAPGYANSHPINPSDADRDAVASPDDPTAQLVAAGHHPDVSAWRTIYGSNLTAEVHNTNDFGPISTALAWADSLAAILANLLRGSWWRRLGIGLAGALMVILALVITAKF